MNLNGKVHSPGIAGLQFGARSGTVQDVGGERSCLLSDIPGRSCRHDAVGDLQAADARLLIQHLRQVRRLHCLH